MPSATDHLTTGLSLGYLLIRPIRSIFKTKKQNKQKKNGGNTSSRANDRIQWEIRKIYHATV